MDMENTESNIMHKIDDAIQQSESRKQENQNMLQNIFQAPDTYEDNSRLSIAHWLNILSVEQDSPYIVRIELYERSLQNLPGCYKLWYKYLLESMKHVQNFTILSNKFQVVNDIFERCLIFMHKMPRIWLMYCEFLSAQNLITKTRQAYDRALMSLPITQHDKIWQSYQKWALKLECPMTSRSIINRYLQLNPDFREEYVDYLLRWDDIDNAAVIMKQPIRLYNISSQLEIFLLNIVQILEDERFVSKNGKSKYQYQIELCNLVSENSQKIFSIDCEAVIRYGIKKYSDEVGSLWVCLADYFIRVGLFEKARDTFEEGIQCVQTARDFGIIFNAYVRFEEEMINLLSMDEEEFFQEQEKDTNLEKKLNQLLGLDQNENVNTSDKGESEIEYRILRLEKLLERRPILLSNCILRQNRNNVGEWLNRIKIVSHDQKLMFKTYGEALTQITPSLAENGNLSVIWLQLAEQYQKLNDFKNSNLVYHKASQVEFKTYEDILDIWINWIEGLIKLKFYNDAIQVCKKALFQRSKDKSNQSHGENIPYSIKLWSLYIDLERSLGTFETTKAAYKRTIELKIASPYLIVSFATYLEENGYFEESFRVFESAISMLSWPALYEIWILYLDRFVNRYASERLERARDLFEKLLQTCPQSQCKIFYLIYAEMEEKYGLLNHAIEIYDRMALKVPNELKYEAYNLYIAKVASFLGATKTRLIFEKAMEILTDKEMIKMGIRYANLERKLGEIDRSRAIYAHISQYQDPQYDDNQLWKIWEDFEMRHGNVDTYKEYMRIKRSVTNKFDLNPSNIDNLIKKVEEESIELELQQS